MIYEVDSWLTAILAWYRYFASLYMTLITNEMSEDNTFSFVCDPSWIDTSMLYDINHDCTSWDMIMISVYSRWWKGIKTSHIFEKLQGLSHHTSHVDQKRHWCSEWHRYNLFQCPIIAQMKGWASVEFMSWRVQLINNNIRWYRCFTLNNIDKQIKYVGTMQCFVLFLCCG